MRTLCLLAFIWLTLSPALAETLVTSLSSHRVLITSNYTGAEIFVFGAIERDMQTVARATGYDIVVTVRGPRQSIVVREKDRQGPVWINSDQQGFPFAPTYLGVFASKPVTELTSEQIRRRRKVGLSAIIHAPEFTNNQADRDEAFREALLRIKAQEGLYLKDERGVTFLTPSIFRAGIPLPATAPPGNYDVEVALFAGMVILASTTTHFEMIKAGFEEQVGTTMRNWPFLYGLVTALVAVFFGWIANTVFRRD